MNIFQLSAWQELLLQSPFTKSIVSFLSPMGASIVFSLLAIILILLFILATNLFLIWLERRVLGFFQDRYGPNRVGPEGLLQPIADMFKLISKELIVPKDADLKLFILAPVLAFVPPFLSFAIISFEKEIIPVDLNIGVFYALAIASFSTIIVLIAGWASNNKFSLVGAMRAVAVTISYELPIIISILSIVLIVGSLQASQIVQAQSSVWFIFLQPLAFLIFLIAITAELNRVPFDLLEADSELVSGYHTEYSGMMFGFFYVAEYTQMIFLCLLGSILFLGGWQGPFFPSFLWLLLKMYGLIFIMFWLRATLVRIRIDQMLDLSWKVLLPLAILNLILTAFFISIF